jgi:SAM-dependent methyltransferase
MKSQRFYAGLFLITAAVLMFQIIETRILSVISWYYLSFFVISVSMFGLTAGAVWVYLQRDRFTEDTLARDLTYFSGAFAVTTFLALVIQLNLPIKTMDAGDTSATAFAATVWILVVLAIAVPFFYSGIVVSLALTRSRLPIGRIYGVDLAGAACGCLGVLFLLNVTDGPTAMIWVAVIIALAGWLYSGAGIGQQARSAEVLAGVFARPRILVPALVAIATLSSATDIGPRLTFVKGKNVNLLPPPLFEEWNSFSRIAQYELPYFTPIMTGPSPAFPKSEWLVDQKKLNIDGSASTISYGIRGDITEAGFLKYDLTNLAYYLPNRQSAAIIGVGGGRDVLSARVFGVPEITGVEINPIILRLLVEEPGFTEFTGLNQMPGMTFHVDEARSWFARSTDSFDVIQMSLIDTWAATGAGAYTLSENGLYTVEAWKSFLGHLTPGGVFSVSRWYGPGEVNETGRMVSLAAAALMELGVQEPARHLYLASSKNIATLLVTRSPLPAASVKTLNDVTQNLQFPVLLSPGRTPASPILAAITASRTRDELLRATEGYRLDLTPPTDNRPFFFNQLPLHNLATFVGETIPNLSEGVADGNLRATMTLALLIVLSFCLVVGTTVIPLRPAIADVGRRLATGGTAYFLLIGAGFMCAEIGLLQRMSVFLGHPIYSLSIVLFSMILSAGAGSMASDSVPLDNMSKLSAWSAVTGGFLFSLPFWMPELLASQESAALLVRATIAIAIIAPAGFLLGFGFPTGMRLISAVDTRPTPWFWGINGAAGVLASSLAVLFSVALGISATIFIAALCYWLLIPAAAVITAKSPRGVVTEELATTVS